VFFWPEKRVFLQELCNNISMFNAFSQGRLLIMAEKLKDPSFIPAQERKNALRRERMAVLALADVDLLEAAAEKFLSEIDYSFLRRPEVGLLMLEGKTSDSGQRFNLGELPVTRCVVRLEKGARRAASQGYAYIRGNSPRHAELAALFDALLQQEEYAKQVERELLVPLRQRRELLARERAKQTAPTRVEFFTLARGEDK
jgi:alpha-D-ribose 1-methylphosphonate 5-triphosphate synthase subunit PhnG